ncbi:MULTISPECIES: DMT family transporter [Cyanophyceae]|uniref:DMT family transporter n=1 Tax=Cyanophyceae TaxID=3028117 RepID=UPI0016837244|nr:MULTISPECIES: DMT family transporter [Cyanophyceae]MBD1917470.1 DMT family transporter [Phormidium sp. FACHB-77]MBD2029655.1 DMT family transporter [Phormidium sp. FACHB-322]MBD2050916.1 DMT family transporter [Leptolyngbya sp. FACHB-60]
MRGELAALMAAFLWAVATVVFGRLGKTLSPLVLNLAKGAIALVLLSLTLVLVGQSVAGLDHQAVSILALSGVIGIGLGDTAYFAAINHLGPRRALLLETLAPPLAALMALVFLQETLSGRAWLGIGLTLAGVGWVIAERVPGAAPGRADYRGVLYGVLAALGQATGAVMSRAVLADTEIAPMWSSLLRLGGGFIIIVGILRSQGPVVVQLRPLRSPKLLAGVALAAGFGTYLAIYLQQMALKYAATGVAQALTSTSPLFVLPLAAALGDRVSLRAIVGAIVALAGIGILVNG